MQGIILVGGEGTRLRPLTYRTPKAMVPILGRPFLEHMLVYLRAQGVTEIALALGHQPDSIRAYFGDGSRWGVRLTMAVEAEPLGSAGAIKQFEAGLREPFFAFNGDILTNADLGAMRALHARTRAAVSIFFIEVEDPSAFGVARLDAEDRILAYVEKPPAGTAPSRWANAGVWLFEPDVLARIPAGRRSMVETELFPELIAAGERVQAFCDRRFWVDIGTPERYRDVQLRLLEEPALRILPLRQWPGAPYLCAEDDPASSMPPTIAARATISGPVLLGAGVTIEAGARIAGPAAIGSGCHIGANARVARAVLWDRCAIGADARVEESVLATGTAVASGATASGVFAGHEVTVPAGAAVRDARIGPGVMYDTSL